MKNSIKELRASGVVHMRILVDIHVVTCMNLLLLRSPISSSHLSPLLRLILTQLNISMSLAIVGAFVSLCFVLHARLKNSEGCTLEKMTNSWAIISWTISINHQIKPNPYPLVLSSSLSRPPCYQDIIYRELGLYFGFGAFIRNNGESLGRLSKCVPLLPLFCEIWVSRRG